MGSWDATCALSNLNIEENDKVVAFPVSRTGAEWYGNGEWHFMPSVAIYGKYDSYGSLKETNIPENKDKEILLPKGCDDIQDFLQKLRSRETDGLVKHLPTEDKVSIIIMKRDIYEGMLASYRKQKNYNYKTQEYVPLETSVAEAVAEAYMNFTPSDNPLIDELGSRYEAVRLLFGGVNGRWYFEGKTLTEEQCKYVEDVILTKSMFDILRKTPTPDVMAGSQDTNFNEIKLLAELTLKEVSKVEERYKDEV